ncbi:MAG: hypothetical protein PVF47_13545 [Anaerolineae bacterium]
MTRLWPEGELLAVWGEGPGGLPAGFAWRGVHHRIAGTHNRWRIHTCWWLTDGMGPIWREYVKVTTGSGLLCLLYHDLPGGGWFLARVYD